MPKSKKIDLSLNQLRQKAIEHGIEFRGMVLPNEWPFEYSHHFGTIRSIGFTSYEDYEANQTVPDSQKRDLQRRSNELRLKAKELLNKPNQMESAWRKLEAPVLERFDSSILCRNCYNDVCKPLFEAKFKCKLHQDKLDAERAQRTYCGCKNAVEVNRDDGSGAVFHSKAEETVLHLPGDDLGNINIPMRPDRLIGLSTPPGLPLNDYYFPTKSGKMLLPFLILEAKREHLTFGWKAIQSQTSFALRRLLKAQNVLRKCNTLCEPCLIWFFASQGEQWRLQAGIHEDGQVKIIDLWQGSAQSQDGALQLLLIIDFVWSWARDVYHPIIEEVISNVISRPQTLSGAPTKWYRRSVSISSTDGLGTTTQDFDRMQVDETTDATEAPRALVQDGSQLQQDQEHDSEPLRDASSHKFLRWAAGQRHSPPWIQLGSIRHSNIIHFEFQWYDFRTCNRTMKETMLIGNPPLYDALSSSACLVRTEQLYRIATLWTATDIETIPRLRNGDAVKVSFHFHSYCDELTWQIKRTLISMLWKRVSWASNRSTRANMNRPPSHIFSESRPNRFNINVLERAILGIRNLHGSDSVACAMQSLSMVLKSGANSKSLSWKLFEELGLSEHAFKTLGDVLAGMRRRNIARRHFDSCDRLLWVDSSSDAELQSIVPALERGTRRGDSMLAARSRSWPSTTSRLCLFVVTDVDYGSGSVLYQLFEEAISLRNFYIDGGLWGDSEWKAVRDWRRALQSEE